MDLQCLEDEIIISETDQALIKQGFTDKSHNLLYNASAVTKIKFTHKTFKFLRSWLTTGDGISYISSKETKIAYKGVILKWHTSRSKGKYLDYNFEWLFATNPKSPFADSRKLSEAPEELQPFLTRIIEEFPRVFNENVKLANEFLKRDKEEKLEKETVMIITNWIKFIKKWIK